MKKNLGKIVDLEKYPIHDLQSDKIKKIIEKCKAELENDSCSVIPIVKLLINKEMLKVISLIKNYKNR